MEYLFEHGDEFVEPYDDAFVAVAGEEVVAEAPLDEYDSMREAAEGVVSRTLEEYGDTDEAVYALVRDGERVDPFFVPDEFVELFEE